MSKLAFFFICAQMVILKSVYSQLCGCGQSQNQGLNYGIVGNSYGSSNVGYGSISSGSCGSSIGYSNAGNTYGTGLGLVGSNAGYSSIIGSGSGSGFGGTGTGQLMIEGGVPIVGNTYVDGNLPILGLVEFIGNLPASGYVTVSGCTPCDCSQYSFGY